MLRGASGVAQGTRIRVKLHPALRRAAATTEAEQELCLPPGATVRHLLEAFDLVHGEVGLVVVNGALAGEAQELPDGARVELYPVFSGG